MFGNLKRRILAGWYGLRTGVTVNDSRFTSVNSRYKTNAGIDVDSESAQRLSAVYSCGQVLAQSVAQLPCILYRGSREERERAKKHPLYDIFHRCANPLQTSYQLLQTVTWHTVLSGNFYAQIVWDKRQRVKALWPWHPDSVTPSIKNGALEYKVRVRNDKGGTKEIIVPPEEVLHIRDLDIDCSGIGRSRISAAREIIGEGLAAQQFGAGFFANGAAPKLAFELEGTIDKARKEELQKTFNDVYGGSANAFKIPVLEKGSKLTPIGISLADAQFLESRKFTRDEICGIFRVPPHMIGSLGNATFSNITHQSLEFVMYTLMPILSNIEQQISLSLLNDLDQSKLFPEFLVDGLLRGDNQSRYQAYAIGIQNGFLTQNEVRIKENLNPVEGGDELLSPLNMQKVGDTQGVDKGNSDNNGNGKVQKKNSRFVLSADDLGSN